MNNEYTKIRMKETYELLRDVYDVDGILIPKGEEVEVLNVFDNSYLITDKHYSLALCSLEDLDYPVTIK